MNVLACGFGLYALRKVMGEGGYMHYTRCDAVACHELVEHSLRALRGVLVSSIVLDSLLSLVGCC